MWERAYGVRATSCRPRSGRLTGSGAGPLRLGAGPQAVLYAAGQPSSRPGRSYRYCVARAPGTVAAVFDKRGRLAVIAASARGYRAGGIAPGAPASRLRGRVRAVGGGLWLSRGRRGRSRFVYVVIGGAVRAVAVISGSEALRGGAVRADVAAAGLP
jgi:hypothetical protein